MEKPSKETRRLWERLHNVLRNEEAWEIIEGAFDEIRNPCRCRVRRRYRLDRDQGECECREERR